MYKYKICLFMQISSIRYLVQAISLPYPQTLVFYGTRHLHQSIRVAPCPHPIKFPHIILSPPMSFFHPILSGY